MRKKSRSLKKAGAKIQQAYIEKNGQQKSNKLALFETTALQTSESVVARKRTRKRQKYIKITKKRAKLQNQVILCF